MKIPPTHYYHQCIIIIITRAFIHNDAHEVPPANVWYVVRIQYYRAILLFYAPRSSGPTKCLTIARAVLLGSHTLLYIYTFSPPPGRVCCVVIVDSPDVSVYMPCTNIIFGHMR